MTPFRPARRRLDVRGPARRRGAALLLAIIVAGLCAVLTIGLLRAGRLRAMAAANTRDTEIARYAAEAGLHRALAELEADITWRAGVTDQPFPRNLESFGLAPAASSYSVSVTEGADGRLTVRATGTVPRPGGAHTRVLVATVKQGG